jgi:HD-GYP domain-containing protein (c-di-GMP phosphodiesterase class II)
MRDVGVIVRAHHERWDGTGYPDGLAGEAIPLESRIIACCDTWNAMTTTRAYRPALPEEAAMNELRTNAGSQFDPQVVIAVLAVAPTGLRAHEFLVE